MAFPTTAILPIRIIFHFLQSIFSALLYDVLSSISDLDNLKKKSSRKSLFQYTYLNAQIESLDGSM